MSVDLTKLPIQFGPYLLKQKIASGGMAEIYLAEATGPGGFKKPLVIKMIHHAYSDDKRFLSMFTEEAKILSSLTHGNIVPIFDFGTANGLLYLAMEFIDGVDAATLVEICRVEGITLPVEVALFIGIGTAAGLSHAHQAKERGVVHRDVSPQNILLSRSGEVKLCDFGLATHTLEEISTNEAIKGKLKYLSPEQARGEPVDGRSDLFSLGVVLYELITGHHPIPSGSGVTVLQELAGGTEYPALANIAPWIPAEVSAIIDKSIRFDKDERFQSGEEMRSALSLRLHKDFPSFTPANLAELVIKVQHYAENGTRDESSNFAYRAKIASFASTTRAEYEAAIRRKASLKKWRRIGLSGLTMAAISGALVMGLLIGKGRPAAVESKETETGDSAHNDTALTRKEPETSISETTPIRSDAGDGGSPAGSRPAPREDPPPPSQPSSEHTKSSIRKTIRATGIVHLNAAPWADVSIDGVAYSSTPILNLKIRAGKHKAVFVNPELGVTKTRTFVVKPDETTTIVVEME